MYAGESDGHEVALLEADNAEISGALKQLAPASARFIQPPANHEWLLGVDALQPTHHARSQLFSAIFTLHLSCCT